MKNTIFRKSGGEYDTGYVLSAWGVLLALLVVGLYGCGGSPCPSGQVLDWCGGSFHCCRPPDAPTCCPMGGPSYSSLSQIPKPDLSYTNLDGLVDFGKTTLKVEVPSDGDHFETKLKGRIAIVGEVCAEAQCPLQVVLVELRPMKDTLTSAKGRPVSNVFIRNANTWTGTRLSDGRISMDATNKLALEATIDGQEKGAVLNPNPWFEGSVYYNVTRMTDAGSRVNNRIAITGSFADENVNASLTISIWATNCEPMVKPTVRCMPNIESGLPGYVHFDSDFLMLANLQSSQDLCDALLASKYEDICTSGGSAEFPTFSCNKQPLPSPTNKVAMAKLLKFQWKDAKGIVLSNQYTFNLNRMPVFPVTLTVENKWGKTVSATLKEAPVCSSDVKLEPGACAWMQLSGPQSHQRSDNWCPAGSFLTALDLEGGTTYAAHDAPLVGYARCCAPDKAQAAGWASCTWTAIGRRSHEKGTSWCADNAFLTALDLDRDQELSAHDSPIVGYARCCTLTGPAPSETSACSWVEVGRRSHHRGGNWCPTGSYLAALDLDSDSALSAHDSPVVGQALCCPLSVSQQGSEAMEYSTNRAGSDYRNFALVQADPALCQKACDEEAKCKAWTYVKPGIQGSKARCWLKHSVPIAKANSCCVSGVK